MNNKVNYILVALIAIFFIGKYFYQKPKYKTGEAAPDFNAVLMNGNTFKLSDLSGNYVLVDFWGSWCGPCRAESDQIVNVYNTFHNSKNGAGEGFKMLSIAIETNEKSWKRAIQTDGYIWDAHIVQLDRFKSPIAKFYGVKEIPTKYLLNPAGSVIAVNPSFKEIEELLSRQLN